MTDQFGDLSAPETGQRIALRFVAPVLISLAVMLIAAMLSVELLSTIRAYVGGEGLFSKGQKNAVFFLAEYSVTQAEDDYQQYLTSIAFPLGDREARHALQRRPVDLRAAREGLLAGGNDPADIESIIVLFRVFGGVGPVRRAIDIWAEGDTYTERICLIATRLHQATKAGASPGDLAALRAELNRINRELTPLAARFSSTLGEVARITRSALLMALTLGSLITAVLCIRVTKARVTERKIKERGLARVSELYAALSKTSKLISRVDDQTELFDELCRICVSTSKLSFAAIGLTDPNDASLRFAVSHSSDDSHAHAQALAIVSSAEFDSAQLALRDGRTHVSNQLARSQTIFRASAAVPLHCQDTRIGVLCVFSTEASFFEADIIDLLEQLAMEASFALETLRRESERRYQATLLADQNRILNLVASGAELRVIFTTLAQFLESQSPGLYCALASLDTHAARYALVVAPSLPAGFDRVFEQTRLMDGAPVSIGNLATHPLHASYRDYLVKAGLRSVRVWPVSDSRGQVLGSLSLYSRKVHETSVPDPRLMGICTDLAGIAIEGRGAADRIRHLAHHDDLTSLPNRLLFNHHLPRALARAERSRSEVAVFFLDLDRFKIINDTLGHGAGDKVLCQVSCHLQDCLRAADTLARVGGDEFTVLVERFESTQDLSDIAQKLLIAASQPLVIEGQECRLTGSIGIAIYPKDGSDGAALLKNADIAMYRAKASGRNNYQFYASEINSHSIERLTLENELRQAVARREFAVHYQPKIGIVSGDMVGAEALVRWQHPQRGLLFPKDFIDVAEEVGLIGSIGRLVLEQVCRDCRRWRDQGLPSLRIAINLSAQQFADSRLLVDLDNTLRDTGCDPQSLEFEITESVVMTSPEKAMLLLEQIKEHGITIAIDDFGTGHSSLAYLKRFPVDSVKIDYTFIRDIADDANDLAITKAIIALGHSLGLKVIAEGVETHTQLDILTRCSCDEFQGFLGSPALPHAEFAALCAEGINGRYTTSRNQALVSHG